MPTIKAGFRITVTTWENDADNYNTKTMDGFSQEEAKFLIDLFKLFYSKNRQANCFGNIYEVSASQREKLNEAILAVVRKHPVTKDFFEVYDDEEFEDVIVDCAKDLLYDFSLRGGEFYTRVLDTYKVEYIPEAIDIQDVTAEF